MFSARGVKTVKVASLIVDRQAIGPQSYKLAKHLEQGGTTPPIHVVAAANGRWRVLDGRHRALAHKLLGRIDISATIGIQSPSGDTSPDL